MGLTITRTSFTILVELVKQKISMYQLELRIAEVLDDGANRSRLISNICLMEEVLDELQCMERKD